MKKKYGLFNLLPKNYKKLFSKTLMIGFCTFGFLSTSVAQIQFVYTSDAHYGITRARFQKTANVGAQIVNQSMISKMNNLTNLTFPLDGGVRSGSKVDSVDFVIMSGDIANRSETTIIPTLSASTCWSQFANDYINGITLKDKVGNNSKLYLLPGNHDVSNAIGFYKTMSPLKDSSAMVNIYNLMMPSPRPAGNYNYSNEKIHYSKNIGGIHLMFVCMWPDSAERVWMTNDLATVSSTTPVFIFTHDQPLIESKHLSNPNSPYTINSTNKFENLLLEKFKDGSSITSPTTIEQNGFASFVQSHPNIVVYFHGNDNQNNYYKYYGPSNNIAIDVIQVDSPMKGNISASDETKLSFQLITIDTLLKVMTVRECLWNTDTNNVNTPIVFGATKSISYDVANYAQSSTTGNTKISSASDLHLMHPSLLVNDGVAFQTYLASDRKLIKESDAIMQELKNRIYEERPEIFLVPGDLTKDGEKISHQLMATYLDSIEMNGVTKVYVIPGNHDVNNVTAYSYDGNNVTKVDSVSPSDFKSIYNNFGYGEAVKTDSVSLSYLAKPKSKLWILGIDVLEYDSNMVAGQAITEGKFKPATYKWVLDRLKEAKDSSAVVLGMMHHGLTEHYTGQSIAFPEYVVKGWDTISSNFAKAGLKMMFTGHYHANDITKKSNTGNTSFVYDIETGSTVTWPCPYRVMDLKGDSILSVVTNHIQNINYNTNGMTFQNYALNYLNTGMNGIVNYQLTHPPYSLDAITAGAIAPHVVSAFVAHYAGDEVIPVAEQGFISYLNSVGQTSLAASLTSLWTDLIPSDNLVNLPLRSSIDTINTIVNSLNQNDYTVPSWTLFLRAKTALVANQDSASIANMYAVIAKMKSSSMPYNIVMNINKDPKTKMAFNWFTNVGITGGQVQIVAGNTNDTLAFNTPLMVVSARCDSAKNLNYSVSSNGLLALAGIADNSKKTYMFNKALVNGLTPNTQYSFRVGKNGAWSTIGSFKTAKSTKEPFSFVYFTDPQANTDAMFNVSQTTTHAAQTMYPNANFWLSCGDLVESSGASNSEWEYEQFFETQQDIFMKNPFAPIEGNHDISTNKNFTYHFNTDSVAFDYAKASVPGSLYSYVYGDALFMHMTYENYSTTGYLDSLAVWMNNQVKANPTVKWKIAVYHKTMFTGSGSHQSDADGKTVRLKMGPVFDSLKIDLALQGHDHIYEIMGPIKNVTLIPNTVSNQTFVAPTIRDNITGRLGGTFETKQGTLYFLNNSAGKKKYEPRTQAQMAAVEAGLGVTNYFGMFTGRFGQDGLPTFSNVTISTDSINISTYSVDSLGNSTLFDAFKVVKTTPIDSILQVVSTYNQSDYTVPSWTLFLRVQKALIANKDSASYANMLTTLNKMKSSSMPYNIVMNINKDPKTKMAFNWFTNAGVTGGQVQIVAGNTTDTLAFATPLMVVSARCDSAKNLNYNVSANGLLALTGLPNNTKMSYMFNKALAEGLTPNTQYSFRVGKNGAWSTIGTFKTAKATKEPFSFVYFTDPQANTDAMFDISQRTTHAAQTMYPNANFWLSCGDLVETSGTNNSEWEYEQFFETQQDIFMKNPFVSVEGNHDISSNKNFTYHFNNDSVAFDYSKATVPGSVYSYVYGDALFMHLTYENYSTTGYLDSLANWMNTQVKANPTAKWRIAVYHKTMYTGSGSHQSDSDGKTVRLKMGPVFDSLKIDLALQGHDHIYEVIGPIKNITLIPNAISNQQIVTATPRENVTGLLGGTFNTKQGTLYFLNNSGGRKKYEPRSQAQMAAVEAGLGVTNYFGMFTGRFGQTGEPTFSNVTVSTDTITISTYTVDSIGNSTLFDSFKVVKSAQDNTWNGNSGNNWDKASNWSEELTPTQSQNVIIPVSVSNYPTVSLPTIINNLTLQSDSTGTASLLDNSLLTIGGSANIKCYITGNKWHMISIPVQSATSSIFNLGVGQPNLYVKGFNAGNWTNYITNTTTPLIPKKAYALWADTYTNSTPNPILNFAGSINTGNQLISTDTSWNLIGNPYTSAIDWNTLNLTNVNGQAVRVWNHDLQLYSTYSAIGGGVNGGNQYLSPMQGFFVKALNTQGISLSNANRVHSNQAFQKSTNSISNLVKIKAQRSTNTDEINIVYNTIATNSYDDLYDANKLFVNDINIPQIYSLSDNNELAINVFGALPAAIPINIKLGVADNVVLTASDFDNFDSNISIKLEDIYKGTIQNLRQNPVYSFVASANENANRFILHFDMSSNSISEASNNTTNIYAYGKTIYVNTTESVKEISVYDILGQLITSKVRNGKELNSIVINKASAFYLVKVTTDKSTYAEKVFIK